MNTLPYNYSHTLPSNQLFLNETEEVITMQPRFRQFSDIMDEKSLHKTAVLVIMSILIFISISISGAVLVFCKKKNAVFIHQISDKNEKDYEYEMDDINTDGDSSETVSLENEPIRSQTYPMISDIVSKPIKTRYKFIPKSNTFSGTDNQRLDHCGSPTHQLDNFTDSFRSSSSPSLNFQSLTIKVDVEPCQRESQSFECLQNNIKWNEFSNTCVNQHHECLKSYSEERLNGLIPWDLDSGSLEIVPFIDTSITSDSDNFIIDCEEPTYDNQTRFEITYNSQHFSEIHDRHSSEIHKNEDSFESDEAIYKPLLTNKNTI